MRWETHNRITYAACRYFGLGEDVSRRVADFCVLVDRDPDFDRRGRRVPHHSKQAIRMAERYLKKAIKARREGKPFEWYLGRALHYVQDYSMNPKKKVLFFEVKSKRHHDSLEDELRDMQIDYRGLEEVRRMDPKVGDLKKLMKRVGRQRVPEGALESAVLLSGVVVYLVLKYGERRERPLLRILSRVLNVFGR